MRIQCRICHKWFNKKEFEYDICEECENEETKENEMKGGGESE